MMSKEIYIVIEDRGFECVAKIATNTLKEAENLLERIKPTTNNYCYIVSTNLINLKME